MSAPHLLLRRLPKVLRKEALRQKELDSFVSNYPLSDFIDFSLDTGGPITIGPRQGISVANPYDVELIWVLLIILENHFPIVAGQHTWVSFGRISGASHKTQKEKRGNYGKHERSAR